jgi:DTW domain-containing protein YfiP
VQRVPALRRLPRLSLPGPDGGERLRTPTVKEGMSTIEAIARALELLGEPAAARALDAAHALAIRRADDMRGFTLAKLRGED